MGCTRTEVCRVNTLVGLFGDIQAASSGGQVTNGGLNTSILEFTTHRVVEETNLSEWNTQKLADVRVRIIEKPNKSPRLRLDGQVAPDRQSARSFPGQIGKVRIELGGYARCSHQCQGEEPGYERMLYHWDW